MSELHETDVLTIGAGPVGLFAAFELGLLGLNASVVDILDKPGGQCAELYPQKPIYDIPAWPVISGQELTNQLLSQIRPFEPVFHLNEMVTQYHRNEDGSFIVNTDQNRQFHAKVMVIAAGGGSFTPKKPPIAGIDAYEGTGVLYAVRQQEALKGKRLVIAGGGDSALDWTLALTEIAAHITLLHRRDQFRAVPDSVSKMRELVQAGRINLRFGQLKRLEGTAPRLEAVCYQDNEKQEHMLPCDILLPFFGLTMKAGPVAYFGLEMHQGELIKVDTEKFETSAPGIFAIGDINWYPGKLKLILSGFHEAALMAQAAFRYCRPGEKLRFQYTTSSSELQRELGVNETS